MKLPKSKNYVSKKPVYFLLSLILVFICYSCATTGSGRSDLPKGNPDKLKTIGENYLAARKYALALRYFHAAEQAGDKKPELFYDIAIAYKGRGFTDKALKYLKKALEINKNYSAAHNALGALLAEQGKLAEAEREFKIALNDPLYETPHYAAYNLANIYYRQGKYKEAKAYYEQTIELAPAYAPAHFELGRTLEALGDLQGAWIHYKEAVQYSPRWAAAQFHYGRLSYRFGKIVAARYSFEQVLKLAPDSDLAKAAIQYLNKMHVKAQNED